MRGFARLNLPQPNSGHILKPNFDLALVQDTSNKILSIATIVYHYCFKKPS